MKQIDEYLELSKNDKRDDIDLIIEMLKLSVKSRIPIDILITMSMELGLAGLMDMENSSYPQRGYVYLIQAVGFGNPYKIGRTKNVDKRLQMFNVKLPFETNLIHTIVSRYSIEAEKELQNMFKNKAVKGNQPNEWYDLSDADVRYIKSIKSYDNDSGFIFDAPELTIENSPLDRVIEWAFDSVQQRSAKDKI